MGNTLKQNKQNYFHFIIGAIHSILKINQNLSNINYLQLYFWKISQNPVNIIFSGQHNKNETMCVFAYIDFISPSKCSQVRKIYYYIFGSELKIQISRFLRRFRNNYNSKKQLKVILNKKHRIGILNKTQRDIIQGDVENNQTHHLAQFTIDIIKTNKDQWGLHILEILTFISRKLVRKGSNTLNQFQIHLTKLQYVTENKDDQIQLWTQQLFQMLRLVAINNKFIRPQTKIEGPTTLKQNVAAPPPLQKEPTTPPPTLLDKYVIRDAQHQKELEEFEKQYREYQNNLNDTNRNSRLITKKVLYSENEEDWSSTEEQIEYDLYDKAQSEKDDSGQHTYYIDSQSEFSEVLRNHYRKICEDANVKYVIGKRGYQIGNQEIKVQPQQLLLNSNDLNYTYNQQVNKSKDIQTITKAELIQRFDTRESCISIWLNSINTTVYKQIKKLAQVTDTLFTDISKATLKTWYDKRDATLKKDIQEKLGDMEELSNVVLEYYIHILLIIMKNVAANELSCVSISADYHDHLNKAEIFVKCLQKHTYFLKSDFTQLITTKCKELIAKKKLKFSMNVKHFDSYFKFRDMGETVQILHNGPRKGGRKRRNNKRSGKGRGKPRGGKRRNNRKR